MKTKRLLPALPKAKVDNLAAFDAGLPVLAMLCVSGTESLAQEDVEAALAALYPDSATLKSVIARLNANGDVKLKAGALSVSSAGRAKVEDMLGPLAGRSWSDVTSRLLPGLALGLDMRIQKARAYLARKENLETAALARLFDVKGVGRMPSRAGLRFALLRAFLLARMPECEPAISEITMQNTSRDAISRAILLGAAGLKRGTLRDAESALLRQGLTMDSETKGIVADSLVRAALVKGAAQMPKPPAPRIALRVQSDDLADFAATVRDLARTLHTAPFTGRVAIAQVYDAGIMRGLEFGSLETFKEQVAAACRAGLLDLERYDIAGPLDSVLRDRSRTAFGRDERHFIVNEWI
ncbi:MAG: hypothetical protein KTR19_05365 [Hyphomicrobiales bacterium]|nr:hypothetical protein [Hyphomicrobiales bacterium]